MSSDSTTEFRKAAYSGMISPAMARDLDPEGQVAIGIRLRAYREVRGFTQAQMGKAAGISPAAWSNIERGENFIGMDSAKRLCRQMGLSLDFIFRDDWRLIPEDLADQMREKIRNKKAKSA